MWELCEAGKNTSYAQCTSSLPASQTWCKTKFWCLKWWCHIFSDLLRFEWRMLENQISNGERISKVQREYEENENEWSFWGYFLTSSQDIGVVNKDYRGILSAKNALKYFVCIHCLTGLNIFSSISLKSLSSFMCTRCCHSYDTFVLILKIKRHLRKMK